MVFMLDEFIIYYYSNNNGLMSTYQSMNSPVSITLKFT